MKILGNRILIQPTEPITQLSSGLFLPDSAVQKPNTGRIVAIGTQADSSWQGKTVLYNKLASVEIEGCHLISPLDVRFIL